MKTTKDKSAIPIASGAKMGGLYCIATSATLAAIKYISAPTQILAKTIKILPGTRIALRSYI